MVLAKYILEFVVFAVGACVMILELTGSRILAPYLGTSIFVWTSLIGIVLASLSLGYFWGGRIADKKVSWQIFSILILAASVFIFLTALFKEPILAQIQDNIADLRLGSILGALILLAPASVFLGTVSPYAVRLRIKDVKKSGTTVGNLYAVSTVGSIVGTFLSGFWLISYLGNTKILYLIAIVLIFTSFLAWMKGFRILRYFVLMVFVSAFMSTVSAERETRAIGFVDVDTKYSRIWIYEEQHPASGRKIRVMKFDPKALQSAIFLDSPELVLEYTKFFRMAKHFKSGISSGLLIGGAGYSYAQDFLASYPRATLDVVEIDPAMTTLAKTYFGLRDNPRLNIYHEDGRTFLNRTKGTYDVIFGDAFGASFSIPFQLTTVEAVSKMYRLLSVDGVLLINMVSSVEGKTAKFLKAEYWTLRQFFPQVFVFPVKDNNDGENVQNILLVALKSTDAVSWQSSDEEITNYLSHLWTGKIESGVPVLTDDWAPVDQYIADILK